MEEDKLLGLGAIYHVVFQILYLIIAETWMPLKFLIFHSMSKRFIELISSRLFEKQIRRDFSLLSLIVFK